MRPNLSTLSTAGLDKDSGIPKSPVLNHPRSMSLSSGWPKFPTSNAPVVKDAHERGAGIFRRLSISGATPFQRVREPSSSLTTDTLELPPSYHTSSYTPPPSIRPTFIRHPSCGLASGPDLSYPFDRQQTSPMNRPIVSRRQMHCTGLKL